MNYKGNVFRYKLGFESWGIAFYIRENDSFKGLDKVSA
jgi:hypothetical protein